MRLIFQESINIKQYQANAGPWTIAVEDPLFFSVFWLVCLQLQVRLIVMQLI